MWPTVSQFIDSMAVFAPMRAAANAASIPRARHRQPPHQNHVRSTFESRVPANRRPDLGKHRQLEMLEPDVHLLRQYPHFTRSRPARCQIRHSRAEPARAKPIRHSRAGGNPVLFDFDSCSVPVKRELTTDAHGLTQIRTTAYLARLFFAMTAHVRFFRWILASARMTEIARPAA